MINIARDSPKFKTIILASQLLNNVGPKNLITTEFFLKIRSTKKKAKQELNDHGNDYDFIAFLQEGSRQLESVQRLQSASTPGSNIVLVSILICWFFFIIVQLLYYVALSLRLKRLKFSFAVALLLLILLKRFCSKVLQPP